jgi:hypothetical protein
MADGRLISSKLIKSHVSRLAKIAAAQQGVPLCSLAMTLSFLSSQAPYVSA